MATPVGLRRALVATTALFTALALVLVSGTPAQAATTSVDCDGGDDLQVAIDAATSGDTLEIFGTCGGHFTIDGKTLTLQGVGDGFGDLAALDGMAPSSSATPRAPTTGAPWTSTAAPSPSPTPRSTATTPSMTAAPST